MKYILCLIAFLFFAPPTFSQRLAPSNKFIIKGVVKDSITQMPVGYAAVTAYLKDSTRIAGGSITDEQGAFTIDQLPPGAYRLKTEYISYRVKMIYGISVDENKPSANAGTISISSSANTMKEVTIAGTKKFMENHLDKFVYNVENDVTSQGGGATDILKKLPQVSIDIDGNVSLLGNSNIRVFINGKASSMFDNNLAEALQAIPASQIKSVEVITTPGAQYDAQGTGGIINIILKSNTARGINGSITASGGSRLENGSGNLHAKSGAFDLSASLSGNAQLQGTTLNSLDNKSDSSRLLQNGQGALTKNGYRGQLGAGWEISKTANLYATVSYNNFGTINNGNTYQEQIPDIHSSTNTTTLRNSDNTFRYRTLDWNINYVKKYKKEGEELDLSYQSSYGRGTTFYDQAELYTPGKYIFNGAKGNNKLTDKESYVIVDYAYPVSKKITLNTGIKGSFSNINSFSDHYLLDTSSGKYLPDPSQSDNFNFKRGVYAAYVSMSIALSAAYTMKIGARDEYTNINIPGDTTDPSYNSFIPSIVIARKIAGSQTLKISYSRRIQRAGYRELNPFINATDPNNLLRGNPYLKPERSNVGELSYTKLFHNRSALLVTLFYRNTEDDEQSYVLHDSLLTIGATAYRNVTLTTNENAGHQQLTGLNISGNLSVSQKLEVRCNAMLFDKYIMSNIIAGATINSFNYRINVNASYQFNTTLAGEFFGNFNSPRTEIQGTFPSFTSYSFAIRKLLFKKKASIALTTTDPFNRYVDQATTVSGPNFSLYSDRKIPYRSFGLSFSYKFGKMEFKDKKQDHTDPNADDGN